MPMDAIRLRDVDSKRLSIDVIVVDRSAGDRQCVDKDVERGLCVGCDGVNRRMGDRVTGRYGCPDNDRQGVATSGPRWW